MQLLSARRQSLSIFFLAMAEKPKRQAAREEKIPSEAKGKDLCKLTGYNQVKASLQSITPTTVHIKPAIAINQYFEIAGFIFDKDIFYLFSLLANEYQ